jgi:phage terminase large subunit-like protein
MANPSLKDKDGTGIIDPKLLEADLQDAMNQPSRKPEYMAKTLDVWTIATTSWISIDKFKPPEQVDLSAFDKSPCYGALDLSSVNDWTAYTLCFPTQGSDFYFKHRFYIPYNTVQERFKKENINILAWIDAGLVTVCNNDTIDYSYIFNDIKKDLETYDIKEIAYDGWRASELVKQIEDEMSQITTFAYPQSLKHMSGPTKNLEKLILDKNIATDCQEIIRWMLGNVQIKIDNNGNYKPLKDYRSSTNRIDGIITMIMSLDRAMVNKEADYSGKYTFEDILEVFK